MPSSSQVVSSALPWLSQGISHPTCLAAYTRFTPSNSGQRLHSPYYRGCWHGVSQCFLWRYRHNLGVNQAASSLLTVVYNPKTLFPHTASLRQAFAHCARFLTAASRRSLGRISVPVWLVALSRQLPVVALVGRYPTNKLMGRGLLLWRVPPKRPPFTPRTAVLVVLCGISTPFEVLSPTLGQITHVLLTRPPLYLPPEGDFLARLACVMRAASVCPEPGSNSPIDFTLNSFDRIRYMISHECEVAF